MKRLLFFAALIVAIGSIGGNMLTAHAQTLTPSQAAALQQQLDVAKATLANLEMQAGAVSPADAGTPSTVPPSIAGTDSQSVTPVAIAPTGLSADQISAFETTLNTLSATLAQLNASVATNSTLTPSQETAVQATLNGMQGTLVAIATDITNGGTNAIANSAPVAATQPASAPVAINKAPSSATVPTTPASAPSVSAPIAAQTPATPVVAAQTSPSTNNTVPQTAQASSLWSFTKAHWPTIVIVLLVIAILAILFWPEKKVAVRTVSVAPSGSGKPISAPTPTATPTAAKPMTSTATPPPATPVANAVAAPSQK
jgi:Meckel syndrome type 1 protein